MRVSIDVVYEGGQLWFEVAGERTNGDAVAFGASTQTVEEALNRAIANAHADGTWDVEQKMTVVFMERLREILGPVRLSTVH